MHEFVHCFGSNDPSSTTPPCVASPSTGQEGPIVCQTAGAASLELTREDIVSMRSGSAAFGGGNLVDVKYIPGVIDGSGNITTGSTVAFTRELGLPAPRSLTPPRLACAGDQDIPDCVMVTTERTGSTDGTIRVWTMDDNSSSQGPQLHLTTTALLPSGNGTALTNPDIAFSREGATTYGSAVVVWSNPGMFPQFARLNMDTMQWVGVNTITPAGGTLSKSEPRVAFDNASHRYVIAFADARHQIQFLVSNGNDPAAAGFAFGPPRRAGPYLNSDTGVGTNFTFTNILDVAPIGPFDIACHNHIKSGNDCRLIFHEFQNAVEDKDLKMVVCPFTVNAAAQTITPGACNRTNSLQDAMVIGVTDYASVVAGTHPGPAWSLSVSRRFPGANFNTAVLLDGNGDFNPFDLGVRLFDIPSSASKFRWGGVAGDYCEWEHCNEFIFPTLVCDPSFSGECL
ncbi:MAG: hypothetical protein AB2A00_26025 [Myxococcota bacterium]